MTSGTRIVILNGSRFMWHIYILATFTYVNKKKNEKTKKKTSSSKMITTPYVPKMTTTSNTEASGGNTYFPAAKIIADLIS